MSELIIAQADHKLGLNILCFVISKAYNRLQEIRIIRLQLFRSELW